MAPRAGAVVTPHKTVRGTSRSAPRIRAFGLRPVMRWTRLEAEFDSDRRVTGRPSGADHEDIDERGRLCSTKEGTQHQRVV
jgi:hypothetical protein